MTAAKWTPEQYVERENGARKLYEAYWHSVAPSFTTDAWLQPANWDGLSNSLKDGWRRVYDALIAPLVARVERAEGENARLRGVLEYSAHQWEPILFIFDWLAGRDDRCTCEPTIEWDTNAAHHVETCDLEMTGGAEASAHYLREWLAQRDAALAAATPATEGE